MLESQINREYVRTDCWSVVAKASKDENDERWFDVRIPNIAAGGLLFLSDLVFESGDSLWFELQIDPMTPGVVGNIRMKVKGEVKGNRGEREGLNSYSVVFTEISHSNRIRLDELILMTNMRYKLESTSDIFDR